MNVRIAAVVAAAVLAISCGEDPPLHVTVANVRVESIGPFTQVTGTVRNTGSVTLTEWTVWARFYTDAGGLLAEMESYSSQSRVLPLDAQQVFEVTDDEIQEWGYYTLEFFAVGAIVIRHRRQHHDPVFRL